jgi:lysophospholipase L1-like esterase
MNKKKYFLVLLFFVIGVAVLAEKMLALKSTPNPYATDRFIRLKELKPSFSGFLGSSRKILLRTDENGFIMPSRIHEEPDLSIVFLGGSTTECKAVNEENRFPYLAGRLIEKNTGLKVNSYNSGVAANDSLHSIDILVNKIIPMKPDIVVMMHNINDLSILLFEGTYWHKNRTRSPIIALEFKPSLRGILKQIKDLLFPNLYSTLYVAFHLNTETDEFSHARGKKIIIDKANLLNEFKMNLQLFINICKARKISPVVMTQPNRFKDTPDREIIDSMQKLKVENNITYKAYKEIYDLFNEAIREVGADNNILVIDLDRQIQQEEKYMYDVVHLNDTGSRLAAEIIARDLKPLIGSLRQGK